MNPIHFAVDTERLFDVLVVVAIASFFVERALALVFESRWFIARLSQRGLKEPITLLLSCAVCRRWDFDAISVLFAKERTQLWGHLLTGAIIAGGSKASIRLFHDVIGAMSNAEAERKELQKSTKAAPTLLTQ